MNNCEQAHPGIILSTKQKADINPGREKCHRVDERVESNPVNFAHIGLQFQLFTCSSKGSSLGKNLFYHIWLGGGS